MLPEKIGGGLIILRDGDPGNPEQALGGFGSTYYQHAVEGPGGVQASFDFRGAKNDAAGRMLTVTLTILLRSLRCAAHPSESVKVVGHLAPEGRCHRLGRQLSDKPQGRNRGPSSI